MTSSAGGRDYVAALTGLRGVAAFGVFLFHFRYLNPDVKLQGEVTLGEMFVNYPLVFGSAGVDLFFVLSGFLLTLPFAAASLGQTAPPDTARYFRRRLLRVFPAYYAQLLIILVVGGWFVTWHALGGWELAAHAAMFFHIGPYPVEPVVGVWWTLPVELSFYLLLPLLARFMTPSRWPVLLFFGLAAAVAYRYWAAVSFDGHRAVLVASQLPGSLPEFLLGATAALAVHRFPGRTMSPRLLDAGFLLGPACIWLWHWMVMFPASDRYWDGHWSMLGGTIALGLAMALMVWCVYQGSPLARALLANRVVYGIGLISYSLYLWHFVVMQQIDQAFGSTWAGLPAPLRLGVSTLAVVTVATASYWLVERPFFKVGGSRGRNPAGALPGAGL